MQHYEDSKCPYHRAVFWLMTRWAELLVILVFVILLVLLSI